MRVGWSLIFLSACIQEEERERRMDFVPEESAVNTELIEVRPGPMVILMKVQGLIFVNTLPKALPSGYLAIVSQELVKMHDVIQWMPAFMSVEVEGCPGVASIFLSNYGAPLLVEAASRLHHDKPYLISRL